MPGAVGPVATVINTIFSWFVDEDGFKETLKRNRLKAKKEECRRALIDNRWDDLRTLTDELQRLSNEA